MVTKLNNLINNLEKVSSQLFEINPYLIGNNILMIFLKIHKNLNSLVNYYKKNSNISIKNSQKYFEIIDVIAQMDFEKYMPALLEPSIKEHLIKGKRSSSPCTKILSA